MTYTVNPADPTTPTDLQGAMQGAEEFRALKGRVNGLALGSIAEIVNRIINGQFRIDQRNSGAAFNVVGGAGTAYTLDRWFGTAIGAGTFAVQREADALYPGEFRLKASVITQDAALAATDFYSLGYAIEGNDVVDLQMGSATAQELTIAFEIESSLPGTYQIALQNSARNRSYALGFTISLANTREVKVLTFPGDTGGTWLTDAGVGVYVFFSLAAGSNFNFPTLGWLNGNYVNSVLQTNFMATNGNTLRIKNFRAYKGATDLGISERLLSQEISLCERYCQKSYNYDVTPGAVTSAGVTQGRVIGAAETNYFSLERRLKQMRATPTVTWYSDATGTAARIRNVSAAADITITSTFNPGMQSTGTPSSAGSGGAGDAIRGHFLASAEL